MASGSDDHEELIVRHWADNWSGRIITVLVPAVIAIGGWAFTLQSKIDVIGAKQEERGPRLVTLEEEVHDLARLAHDPAPKPETKVAVEEMKRAHRDVIDRLDRLEDRVNALHNYLLQMPARPPFKNSQRGDLFSPGAGEGGG